MGSGANSDAWDPPVGRLGGKSRALLRLKAIYSHLSIGFQVFPWGAGEMAQLVKCLPEFGSQLLCKRPGMVANTWRPSTEEQSQVDPWVCWTGSLTQSVDSRWEFLSQQPVWKVIEAISDLYMYTYMGVHVQTHVYAYVKHPYKT